MTAEARLGQQTQASRIEREMLARLGLSSTASDQEIETARDAIAGYLSAAPVPLHAWASRQLALTDEAYGLLLDPSDDAIASIATEEPVGLAVAGRASRQPLNGTAAVLAGGRARRRLGPVGRVLIAAVAVVAVATVGYAVYAAGQPAVPGFTGTPAPEASGTTLDLARVGQLMQQIQANPKDTAALSELGDLYFQSGDYRTAADWMTKVLGLDPKNVNALLGLGAAKFNQGDSAGAETEWKQVITVAPKNQEAYYDLGFMYLSKEPPDITSVRAMWDKVIEIDPNSDVAKTVQTHLDSFASASPGASASAGPPAGGSGATSPAPSSASAPSPSATPSQPSSTTAPSASAGN